MRAAESGVVTTSSLPFSGGMSSRFIATAVARTSMWPISSVPGVQQHVAVLLRPAAAPGLEEVLVYDAPLALGAADRLLQHAREDRVGLVDADGVRKLLDARQRGLSPGTLALHAQRRPGTASDSSKAVSRPHPDAVAPARNRIAR